VPLFYAIVELAECRRPRVAARLPIRLWNLSRKSAAKCSGRGIIRTPGLAVLSTKQQNTTGD